MPSNHTPNYQLNQWEKSDRVLMEDFNADNAKTDAAIKAVDKRVDGKADASALADLARTVASERIHVSSYEGDGTESHTIQLPWAPKMMVLMGTINARDALVILIQGQTLHVAAGSTSISDASSRYDPKLQGATLRLVTDDWCNDRGRTFHYILLR